jgi:predicted aldo/keto reductase-like oxidoreductase
MVLSGMSNLEQVLDNIKTMKDFKPLTQEEIGIIEEVRTIYQGQNKIPCTACCYCTEGCPAGLNIPELFACFNDQHQKVEGAQQRYADFAVKADACIGCGHCETVCPQHLQIPQLMQDVARAF